MYVLNLLSSANGLYLHAKKVLATYTTAEAEVYGCYIHNYVLYMYVHAYIYRNKDIDAFQYEM